MLNNCTQVKDPVYQNKGTEDWQLWPSRNNICAQVCQSNHAVSLEQSSYVTSAHFVDLWPYFLIREFILLIFFPYRIPSLRSTSRKQTEEPTGWTNQVREAKSMNYPYKAHTDTHTHTRTGRQEGITPAHKQRKEKVKMCICATQHWHGKKNPTLACCNELDQFPSWGGSTLQPLWHVVSLYKLTTSWTGREECHEVTNRSSLALSLGSASDDETFFF